MDDSSPACGGSPGGNSGGTPPTTGGNGGGPCIPTSANNYCQPTGGNNSSNGNGAGNNGGGVNDKLKKGSGGGHNADIANPALGSNSTQHDHWCGGAEGAWIDCALSGVGLVASMVGTALIEIPGVPEVAVGVDLVVTVWSIARTEGDHNAGRISETRRWLLNGTGVVGLFPIWPGVGASLVNTLFTVTGYPE